MDDVGWHSVTIPHALISQSEIAQINMSKSDAARMYEFIRLILQGVYAINSHDYFCPMYLSLLRLHALKSSGHTSKCIWPGSEEGAYIFICACYVWVVYTCTLLAQRETSLVSRFDINNVHSCIRNHVRGLREDQQWLSVTRDAACVSNAPTVGEEWPARRSAGRLLLEDKIEDKCFIMCLNSVFSVDLFPPEVWCCIFTQTGDQ